jgi:serine/threonine-protein kinase
VEVNEHMQATERTNSHPSELLQSGDSLGRYQLLCPIARGGMGQVWAARQTGRLGLPKLVAIKTAIPIASKDYHQVEKFLFDEAFIAASIDHPNVCKILELGQERDVVYIAMEWLNGVPLSALVSKVPQRRLDYRMAAHLVAQACSGLHAAHELTDDDGVNLEVVHRDATPHNFMITSAGELKVMDFGIVKAKNQQHQATQTGELKGKISYLTPEQLRGGDVDRRTDVFTLGCVLYVITVGKVAFNPDTDHDVGRTILRIINGDYIRPSAILSDYPPELEAIVEQALATSPAKRFQTAEEMRRALESFLGDSSRSVSREDVAALLREYCGGLIEQRRWEIRSAQKLFDSQSGEMRSGSYPVADRSCDVGSLVLLDSPSDAGSTPQWSHSSPQAATVRPATATAKRKPLWRFAAAAVLILATLGAYALRPTAHAAIGQGSVQAATGAEPIRGKSNAVNPQTELQVNAAPSAAQSRPGQKVDPEPSSDTSMVTSKGSHKTSTHRVASRKVSTIQAETNGAAAEGTPAAVAPNTPFTQPLSRKPVRHAIDESDPFEK